VNLHEVSIADVIKIFSFIFHVCYLFGESGIKILINELHILFTPFPLKISSHISKHNLKLNSFVE